MANLAIIPARGGSKRIPGKNIKDFLGKPIIAYSIEAALQSKLFDVVMVSTDDEEISAVSKRYGAEVPFFRSKENSDDFAGTAAVLIEVLQEYKKDNVEFEFGCCIYPTAPFVTAHLLTQAYKLLIEKKIDTIFPVVPYSSPIQRALTLDDHNKVSMIYPENYLKRSQDFEKTFHDAGQFYWFESRKLIRYKRLWTSNSNALVLSPFQVQDIDNQEDWELAELKFRSFRNNSKL